MLYSVYDMAIVLLKYNYGCLYRTGHVNIQSQTGKKIMEPAPFSGGYWQVMTSWEDGANSGLWMLQLTKEALVKLSGSQNKMNTKQDLKKK